MTSERKKQLRRTIRILLKARAWAILADVDDRLPTKSMAVSATNGATRIDLTVGPSSIVSALAQQGGPPPGVHGLFLSPMCAAIVNALMAGGCREGGEPAMSGKQIAARISQEYATRLKYLLLELEDRLVIVHTPNEGYRIKNEVKPSQAA